MNLILDSGFACSCMASNQAEHDKSRFEIFCSDDLSSRKYQFRNSLASTDSQLGDDDEFPFVSYIPAKL
jgi:hypothetical protein